MLSCFSDIEISSVLMLLVTRSIPSHPLFLTSCFSHTYLIHSSIHSIPSLPSVNAPYLSIHLFYPIPIHTIVLFLHPSFPHSYSTLIHRILHLSYSHLHSSTSVHLLSPSIHPSVLSIPYPTSKITPSCFYPTFSILSSTLFLHLPTHLSIHPSFLSQS